MARSDHDYLVLRNLLKILSAEKFPSEVLSEAYRDLFGESHPPRARWHPEIEKWESVVIARGILISGEIISKYVQLFHDPREVPVTHSWKQKQLAIFLDEKFSEILWEGVRRSHVLGQAYDIYEETQSDAFLDKPVLFLKEEAREKRFPSIAKRPSLTAIQERYLSKVRSSGILIERLEHLD